MNAHGMLPDVLVHWKPVAASIAAAGSFFLAETVDSAAQQWESIGLKGILIIAVLYLARYVVKLHEKSSETLTTTVKENTEAMRAMKNSTDQQTAYFQTIAHTLIDRQVSTRANPDA